MADVHVVTLDNGVGLSSDARVVQAALLGAGLDVASTLFRSTRMQKRIRPVVAKSKVTLSRLARGRLLTHRVNIMLEHVYPEYLGLAEKNVLIPNPEWFGARDQSHLPKITELWVKTQHAVSALAHLQCPVRYVGFTSSDRYELAVPRETTFVHLAGRSTAKATDVVLTAWSRHPTWPSLTVVQHPRTARRWPAARNIRHHIGYMADAQLRHLQNANRFHLCPSTTEGFGHYIVEALSVGAVTLVTDGPPMNELVTRRCGLLIPWRECGRQNLAATYLVDVPGIEDVVERALALSDEEVEKLSARARESYLNSRRQFERRLVSAVMDLL